MFYFRFLFFIYSCIGFSQSTNLDYVDPLYEKTIPHDKEKHTVYLQGGETDKNRLTNNEYAINFLKKEVATLKKKLSELEKSNSLLKGKLESLEKVKNEKP